MELSQPSLHTAVSTIRTFPAPFNFYRLVLHQDHLHFGCWPQTPVEAACDPLPDAASDAAREPSLETAQEHMQGLLLAALPPAPAAVLDVGCGLGLTAATLAARGYQVTAIAPSEALIGYAHSRYSHTGAQFITADFMQQTDYYTLPDGYDAVIFQESLQYLRPLASVFAKVRRLLNPAGRVVLTDEVCHDTSLVGQTAVHTLTAIKNALAENGLRILEHRNLDQHVGRTCSAIIARLHAGRDRIITTISHADTHRQLDELLQGWQNQQQWYAEGRFGYRLIAADINAVYFRAAQPGDADRILPLFNHVFNMRRSRAHWYWKYHDNPWGRCVIALAQTGDHTLVAQHCGYPVPFRDNLKGRSGTVYQGGDTMTNPSYRQAGIGRNSVLARTLDYFYDKFCRRQVPFIYGFNTGTIRKLGERYLQYRYLSPVACYRLSTKPAPGAPIQRLKRRLLGLRVESVTRMTTEYDDFFNKAGRHYGLLTQRDADYLNWRYLACPDKVHRLLAVRRYGRLLGWGVFMEKEGLLLWGDALFDGYAPEALQCLLDAAIHTCAQPVMYIQGWFTPTPPWWLSALRNCGFQQIPEPNQLAPCFSFFQPELNTAYFEANWYYTMGDSDLF